jgi:hypothetical protein
MSLQDQQRWMLSDAIIYLTVVALCRLDGVLVSHNGCSDCIRLHEVEQEAKDFEEKGYPLILLDWNRDGKARLIPVRLSGTAAVFRNRKILYRRCCKKGSV